MSANPDLPILDELGAEFSRLVDAKLGASPAPARARLQPPLPRGPGRRRARRVARRSGIVLVLLCLVGGVALAARFGGDTGKPAHTDPARLGASAAEGWEVSAYRDRGRLCLLLAGGGELASGCGAEPGARELRATSLLVAERRLVAGVTGAGVRAVAIDSGGARTVTPTRAVVDPAAATAAGIPAGTRWYLVSLTGVGQKPRAPVFAYPLDRGGRRLGPAYVDCSLGVVGRACLAQIRAQAAAGE